jgi:hypothetical protein
VDIILKYFKIALLAMAAGLVCFSCQPRAVGPAGSEQKTLTWAEMNFEQRKAHMRQAVVAPAAELFKSWRPEKYPDADCRLCHGPDAEAKKFNMPTGHLPRLSGALLLGPEFAAHPDTTRLKLNRLVPLMADALGVRSFSLITRRGFGCYSCHLGPDGPMFGN